uniref:Uncharacterized protein n=1 Tax=Compsopogon caeruleus TaxID=31354 RepID=A0A7S1TGC7_9RHOD|mmetsp:Transcript_6043/g.11856  ORF Transcript_6043/g.11856 Transcript_6043/m.11856 type:complete len:520 (+) Transcript_6043:242-1801(+)|eukprot:CAMPEP_0184690810 /NCGR_PEP_ID=MMETSP0312-20130426/31445_1 /TAXON_ID=31354 /ORGANISM="Compsopogon coeruleus, Strain SAG 36.94" /LENGTH=519 /DNA_ID=CAMNT_0027148365 /DNA_START=783 /DNA_END=2342 /DNA_ORIENTATION=+
MGSSVHELWPFSRAIWRSTKHPWRQQLPRAVTGRVVPGGAARTIRRVSLVTTLLLLPTVVLLYQRQSQTSKLSSEPRTITSLDDVALVGGLNSFKLEETAISAPARSSVYKSTRFKPIPGLATFKNRNKLDTLWSFENVCYDSIKQRFTITKEDAKLLPPFFVEDHRVETLSTERNSTIVPMWMNGTTLLSRDAHLDQTGAHFYFFLLPVATLLRHLHETSPDLEGVNVLFDNFSIPAGHDLERQLSEILFGQIPRERRLSLSKLEAQVTCFETLLSVGLEYSSVIQGQKDFDFMRERASEVEMVQLASDCKEPFANRAAVGILNRRVYSRRILNQRQLEVVVRQVFGPAVDIIVFDSPNVACENGCLGFANCLDLLRQPEEVYQNCRKTRSVADDVKHFNNLTMMISVHGAGNINYIWMPKGSHVVEIFPYGISDFTYQKLTNLTDLNYFAFEESNRTVFNNNFRHLGDGSYCWKDDRCRKHIKESPVSVTMDGPQGLKRLLREVQVSWSKRCVPDIL